MRTALIFLSLSLLAADWPQFLGPNRDSITKEKIAPWKETPKVVWSHAVGEAHSSPVIANGIVYAFYRKKGLDDANDAEVLAAFDAATGKEKWEKELIRPKFATPFGAGPQGTPTVAQDMVFTLGNSGHLTARKAATGDLAWTNDTLKEFNAKNLVFGVSTSPIVVGRTVITMVGGKGAGIVAFDITTGKVVWKSTDDPASYSSPIAYGDGTKLAFLTGSHLRGLTADGRELWSYPFRDRANESSTMPVIEKEWLVASSITRGSVGLKLNGNVVEKAWQNDKLTCFFSTPVVMGKHLYMINGVTGNQAILDASVSLRCVELESGKMLWEKPKVGYYHAALVRTGDDRLLMLDDKGYLTLIENNPREYQELARSKVCGKTWAHHAVVDGKVYLRDSNKLICLELK